MLGEKTNFPTKFPYPEHFWVDGMGCHWCGRDTESMVSGHDGMCPVPHVAKLERVAECAQKVPSEWQESVEYSDWPEAQVIVRELVEALKELEE